MKVAASSLLAIATAAVLFAVAPGASAGVLCGSNTTPCEATYEAGRTIGAELKEGSTIFKATFGEMKCTGTSLKGEITEMGEKEVPVGIPLSSLTLSGCSCTAAVLKAGRLSISYSSAMNGTAQLKEVEIETVCAGIKCLWGGNVTSGITVSGGEQGTIKAESASLPLKSGFLCGSTASWSGTYKVTSPTPLYVAEEPLAGLTVLNDPVEIEPGKEVEFEIQNTGTTKLGNLEITNLFPEKVEVTKLCEVESLKAKAVCVEKVKCLQEDVKAPFLIRGHDPLVQASTEFKCLKK